MSTHTALGTMNVASATSASITMSAAIAAGDFIYGSLLSNAGGTLTISDGTNTYVIDVALSGVMRMFRVLSSAALPINTVLTFSFSGTAGIISGYASKVSGFGAGAAFDKAASQLTGTTTTPSSGATATTTAAVEWWHGCVYSNTVGGVTFSAPSGGFTLGQSVSGAGESFVELYQETSATGAANAGCTASASGTYFCGVTTYTEGAASLPPHGIRLNQTVNRAASFHHREHPPEAQHPRRGWHVDRRTGLSLPHE